MSGYQSAMWVIAVAMFVITMAIEILIPKLTVDIEKKLNPEKRGNALDFQFRKVWMSSCDEAERLIVYRAGYQAFLSTNVVCLILCIVTFIFTFLFKTDIMGFVYVCIILLVNNVSYMMRAAKLERRRQHCKLVIAELGAATLELEKTCVYEGNNGSRVKIEDGGNEYGNEFN